MDYQGIGMKLKVNYNGHMSVDSKEERARSPMTNARTNCSTGAPHASYNDKRGGTQFFYRRKPNRATVSIRRSM